MSFEGSNLGDFGLSVGSSLPSLSLRNWLRSVVEISAKKRYMGDTD